VVADWKAIQEKVLRDWEQARIFEADPDPSKEKFFITVAYPYPNSPQHIGHARTYTITDVHARYLRMRGYNVLFPMAFHYTGTPILAMAERIAKGDPELVDDFLRIYHVPKEKLKDFGEPIEIARYFHDEIKRGMKDMGFSIDWRREFTTIDPTYSRFIEWQFKKLREKGLITKGSHPVGWCPNDGNPVGQHDTIGDVEPEIGQYVLLKFKVGDSYLPTATLRPETVFGVTNIWVKPDTTYVKAKVDSENWIISEPCLKKLEYQNRKASIIERVQGSKLIAKSATNPMTGAPVMILPAEFVDPESATGVVMSVPAHAPYDYQALVDLEGKPELLSEFGIGREVVGKLSPIGVVALEGYSDAPAVDVVKRFEIKDQTDPKLEEATTEIYSKEFHSGRMRNDTGNYAGLTVSEARDRVRDDLVAKGGADVMYEIINRPVTCRCGAQCLVKMFENQWFINYGDAKWKELARECLKSMSILPEEFRVEIDYAIGWLREKACARKSGLGTRLPWDKDWIIESLSDSVIYMAYYTLAKHIAKLKLKPEQLPDEILDYLLLGKGDIEKLAKSSGIERSNLKEIRGEFAYFYPVDSRHSGRDLIPNHLTFYIFNHAAIFPPEGWPRQIVTNGSVLMEHAKMSKSFGNIIPLRDAIAQHGADAVRLSTVSAAELIQDVEFSHQSADSLRERIERMYASAQSIVEARPLGIGVYGGNEEKWMLSRLQSCIRDTTSAMDKLRAREAVHHAMYELEQDLSWYMRRATARSGVNPEVVSRVLDIRVRLMAPFTPFISEAIWSLMGKKGFVSRAEWPQPDTTLMDERAEEVESLVRTTVEDVANILKTTGMSVKKLYLYSAADWKWHLYLKALEMASKGSVGVPELMKAASAHPVLKERMKDVSKLAPRLAKDLQATALDMQEKRRRLGTFNEREALEDATGFLSKEFKCTVTVHDETDEKKYDPKGRAQAAQPFRPAIYVE
jgi:leucyl-tRNA synthetase